MSGGIDQIQLIGVAIVRTVLHSHCARLDSDAFFALEIHRIEELLHHLPRSNGSSQFQQSIGQRGFAVVDMRDNAEIPDPL